jgi:hypothetical protein
LKFGLFNTAGRGNSRKNEGDFNHQKYKFWYSRKWQIRKRRGRASIPEKMSENGPVVAEILQFQVLPCLL